MCDVEVLLCSSFSASAHCGQLHRAVCRLVHSCSSAGSAAGSAGAVFSCRIDRSPQQRALARLHQGFSTMVSSSAVGSLQAVCSSHKHWVCRCQDPRVPAVVLGMEGWAMGQYQHIWVCSS
jgi:hypothetical protein